MRLATSRQLPMVRWSHLTSQQHLHKSSAPASVVARALTSHPVTYHPDFHIQPLPDDHRFPMPKDHLLFQALQQQGLAHNTFTPCYPDVDTLSLAHDPNYVQAFINGTISQQQMRQIGLPWSQKLVQRTLIGTGSAVLCARLALQYGVACMTNGGTHHAHYSHGSGWCIFNDQAVAARAAQRDAGVGRLLFVDLDVHQGDGTAAIFAGDSSVFTFSVHCRDQPFPLQLQASSLDVGLPAGTGDREYMQALRATLPGLLADFRPDLVMYNAGVDVHHDDSLGKLALSNEGIYQRDVFVLEQCAAAAVPVACAIGGGYEPRHERIVERHLCLHRAASALLPQILAAHEAKRVARRSAASSALSS